MSASEQIRGSVLDITARVECGGCGGHFRVNIDPAGKTPEGWTIFDKAVDAVRGGDAVRINLSGQANPKSCDDGSSSVQHGWLLCGACTRKVDDAVEEDRNATAAEIERALEV